MPGILPIPLGLPHPCEILTMPVWIYALSTPRTTMTTVFPTVQGGRFTLSTTDLCLHFISNYDVTLKKSIVFANQISMPLTLPIFKQSMPPQLDNNLVCEDQFYPLVFVGDLIWSHLGDFTTFHNVTLRWVTICCLRTFMAHLEYVLFWFGIICWIVWISVVNTS